MARSWPGPSHVGGPPARDLTLKDIPAWEVAYADRRPAHCGSECRGRVCSRAFWMWPAPQDDRFLSGCREVAVAGLAPSQVCRPLTPRPLLSAIRKSLRVSPDAPLRTRLSSAVPQALSRDHRRWFMTYDVRLTDTPLRFVKARAPSEFLASRGVLLGAVGG